MISRATKDLRCAIYTRKSSEEGLEQAFNSLHAQREACEAYIKSQRHEGWQAIGTAYDDRGLSGGTMERPALRRLLVDVEAGRVNVVVVYKVDRLTRSLADFAKIIEVFDTRGVSFVSVTQQFNTTTSMGRLTLNVLLSFAQFEREVTGERIRDKIAASRAKGMWMGGRAPLGYDVRNKRLVVNHIEAATVRLIFERYNALGCVAKLKAELDATGIVSKARLCAAGKRSGGYPFSRGALYKLLSNRVYVGEAVHKGKAYPGEHNSIIDRELFEAAQNTLNANRITKTNGTRAGEPSLLAGLLFDDQRERMSPSHAVKNGKRYRYYVSQALLQNRSPRVGQATRIPAHDIEQLVTLELRQLLQDRSALFGTLVSVAPDPSEQQALLTAAFELAGRWPSQTPAEVRATVRAGVRNVVVGPDRVEVRVSPAGLQSLLRHGPALEAPPDPGEPGDPLVTLVVDAHIKRCGGETRLIIPGRLTSDAPARPNRVPIKALARAYAWANKLTSGQASSIRDIAHAESLPERYVAKIIPLAYLAPDITQLILDGVRPPDLTLDKLCKRLPLPWHEQKRALGLRRN